MPDLLFLFIILLYVFILKREIMKFINLIGVLFFFFPLFRCESGYTGQHCEKTDFSILYVVPSRQKLTHVLIAAIIGAVQIAIIVAIVMCITR